MNTHDSYEEAIIAALPYCLKDTNFDFGTRYQGKVRDSYDLGDKLLLVTTDRQSAFDRLLTCVPYKGQVLNQTSAWWFNKTESIVPNHLIALPNPNVMIVKKCQVFPIEFVVRGYISGTTNTSLWTQYQKGVREYCGLTLKEGLKKNQKLDTPSLTPTTKEIEHDRPISPEDIIKEGYLTEEEWNTASNYALKLFELGTKVAALHGLILVDTKYEFGRDEHGQILLIDEIHTPDSSRYWLADSYLENFQIGKEPENIDKEFLRLWFVANCDPYKDTILPKAPEKLVVTLASRYIQLYEMITQESFIFSKLQEPIEQRIKKDIETWLK